MTEPNEKRERPASDVAARTVIPSMTRRRLLSSTGQIAFFAMLPMACVPVINAPWADGTFWSDGQGWSDEAY
ncbi:MAG: hypothetical protein AAGA21_00295 [Pseudomonadota bacterium]